MKRIVVIGGGVAGVYAAQALERKRRGREDGEILLFCRETYTVFQPMLAEVISGTLPKREFGLLAANVPGLRASFQQGTARRTLTSVPVPPPPSDRVS
jgi:NADH dehydrogenase FAD-containing subunit